MTLNAAIQKIPRHYMPVDFTLSNWETLKPFFEELNSRVLDSAEALEVWLKDVSEIQAVISEDACWRQIRMTCDTENKALEEAFNYFCMEIEPHIKPYADALNKKLMGSPFVKELDSATYYTYLRSVEKEIKLFQENNIALHAELSMLAQHYGTITGKMSVTINEQEYTLQQAAKFLMQSDRSLREEVYIKMNERRKQDEDALNTLFDELLQKRHQVALNAGFDNYRDYKFEELGRFDYTVKDCEHFHEAIKKYITPIAETLIAHKQKQLGLNEIKPYDIDAEPEGQQPLAPFNDGAELLDKSIQVFSQLRPYFGDCLRTMNKLQHFDLESRKGKAPGGYNCPLAETGAPFIFMNAAGTADDVVTMMHEGGHALHSFLSHELPLSAFKEYPMEMAELASMSMELFSMDYWSVFYPNPNDLKRAKAEELERALSIFPWIATIDKFQHWLYTHPGHSHAERTNAWVEIYTEFAPKNISWEGLTNYRERLWQKQLHLFEVPFYYIEYGIAQLGALAMWKQYKTNKEQTLDQYMNALSKGYTQTLTSLYQTAGIDFDFSAENVKALSEFVKEEMKAVFE
ncbi:MAG TPA: M3 family oligoendopeptidase [Chitinophagaceae bacterium]|nr:M3 family oligoendopeptidase [Chitinophagaceae bacterium]